MNPTVSILLGVLAGAGAGYLAGSFASEEPVSYGTGVEAPEIQISRLRNELDELRDRMDEPRGAVIAPRERSASSPDQDALKLAVDAWLDENLEALLGTD